MRAAQLLRHWAKQIESGADIDVRHLSVPGRDHSLWMKVWRKASLEHQTFVLHPGEIEEIEINIKNRFMLMTELSDMSAKKKLIRKKFNDDVFARDGNKCLICGRAVACDAHHITDRKEMPNGGYVAENGISLCNVPNGSEPSCHFKAELFHLTFGKECNPGFHPEDLYRLIGSSKDKAVAASDRLSSHFKNS